MKYQSFISGLAGSLVLTLLHETLRKTVTSAPRMDKMGEEGLSKVLTAAGVEVPSEENLYGITMAGDIIGNAGYYSLVGIKPKYSILTGAALGLAAGIGAVELPGKMGLNEEYSNATPKTQALTLLIYLTGGLVAGAVHSFFERKSPKL